MQSLTRAALTRLLGLGPQRTVDWAEGPEATDADLRIRTYELGAARIPALSIAPRHARPGGPALLYCHAHGNAFGIGKSEVLEGRPALLDPPLAKEIARAGWTVFCADMPGFGARQADGAETALAKAALWHGRPLIGQMVEDQLLALDVLKEITQPSRLATLGISMGGTLAYLIAALREDISLLVHLCVFADLEPLIATGAHDLHGLYMTIPGLLRHHDMGDIAALVAPRRQIVATGGADPLTPDAAYVPAVARLQAAYGDHPDRLTLLRDPAAGHHETRDMRNAVLACFVEGEDQRVSGSDAREPRRDAREHLHQSDDTPTQDAEPTRATRFPSSGRTSENP